MAHHQTTTPDEEKPSARRVTVSLRAGDVERIQRIAQKTKLSANEIIRRALATEDFVVGTRSDGKKILVEDDDGRLRQVEFLY